MSAIAWTKPYCGVTHCENVPRVRGQATVTLFDGISGPSAEAWVHVVGTGFSVPGDTRIFYGPDAERDAKAWAVARACACGLLPSAPA